MEGGNIILDCFDPEDLKRNWYIRRSRGPRTIEELKESDYIVLAHFTSSTFLSNILEQGLIPDTYGKRSIDDNLPSDSESVYLATQVDKYFFKRATKHHGGNGVVVVVRVEKGNLLVDENAIGYLKMKDPSKEDALYQSLCFGHCKHKGPIPPKQIIAVYDEVGDVVKG